jgi:hypothetical protein
MTRQLRWSAPDGRSDGLCGHVPVGWWESRSPPQILRATLDRGIMGDICWHQRSFIVHHCVDTSFTGHERNGAKGS